MRLELGAGTSIAGSIAIDMPAPAGGTLPRAAQALLDRRVRARGPALSFTDSGGNEWTLSLREGGAALQGLLAWRQGGAEQPLAEGFSLPGGQRPLARLSGEVQLRRVAAGGPGAAAPTVAPVGAGSRPATSPPSSARTSSGWACSTAPTSSARAAPRPASSPARPAPASWARPTSPASAKATSSPARPAGTTEARSAHQRAVRRQGRALRGQPVVQQRHLRGPLRPVPILRPPAASAARALGASPGWLTLIALLAVAAVNLAGFWGIRVARAGSARRGAPRLRGRRGRARLAHRAPPVGGARRPRVPRVLAHDRAAGRRGDRPRRR